jgi:hypothetical protein
MPAAATDTRKRQGADGDLTAPGIGAAPPSPRNAIRGLFGRDSAYLLVWGFPMAGLFAAYRVLLLAAAVVLAASCTAVPSTGWFAVARVAATLASLAVFGLMLQRLIAPGTDFWLSRAVGWANGRR